MTYRRVTIITKQAVNLNTLVIEANRLCKPADHVGMGPRIGYNLATLGWWLDKIHYDWEIVEDDSGELVLIGIKKE